MSEATKVYLRDVYDHSVRIIDTVEVLRDVVSGLIDLHLSSLSHKMNEVVKSLTVMAGIFIPLTFFVGWYGMNFHYMPELDEPWGYSAFFVAMLLMTLAQLWYFKRKGWL